MFMGVLTATPTHPATIVDDQPNWYLCRRKPPRVGPIKALKSRSKLPVTFLSYEAKYWNTFRSIFDNIMSKGTTNLCVKIDSMKGTWGT